MWIEPAFAASAAAISFICPKMAMDEISAKTPKMAVPHIIILRITREKNSSVSFGKGRVVMLGSSCFHIVYQ